MDIKLALMCGVDIPIPECQLTIHQPSIKEISMIGEKDYFVGLQCLCINKSRLLVDDQLLKDKSNFEIFMTVINQQEAIEKKKAVQQTCLLLFPTLKVNFTPRAIMLLGGESPITIDSNNFDILQSILAEIGCLNSGPQGQEIFNPANKRAQEIAEKLMKGRQKVAAQKGGESSGSVIAQYLSTLTIGVGSMGLKDVMNLTLYQLYDLVERYMLFVNWDMDIKSRLAGGKPDSQPDNWMKNIH